MLAYGDALAGTGKPLVVSASIGSPGWEGLGRPATEDDPALPGGDGYKGTLRVRNIVETTAIGLAEKGVRSAVVRIPPVMHSDTDKAGFVPALIGLAREKGVIGFAGGGENRWPAVHARDLATLFRLALENGAAGSAWHAVADEGIPFRQIAEAIGGRLNLPAVSIPQDVLMLPGYFGFLANLVTLDLPASSLITRQKLGWQPRQPGLLEGPRERPLLPRRLKAVGDNRHIQIRRCRHAHYQHHRIRWHGRRDRATYRRGGPYGRGHQPQSFQGAGSGRQEFPGGRVGVYAEAPAGDIVVLAVPYSGAAAVVADYGAALAGKIVVDIANPVAPDMSGLVTPPGSSGAQETARHLPASAQMVKAFNTIFGHVLAKGGRLDAFIAGDDPDAKAKVSEFLDSVDLRPLDVGGLAMAQTLEAAGLMMIGLARNGAGTWNFALKVDMG